MDVNLEPWTWSRLWPYAVVVSVLLSWALYHFVAPKSWREWGGAGLVQGFIISLYAEMYGFPLTIYFLTTFLPIDIPLQHSSGHLWAPLLGFGRFGGSIQTILGYGVMLAGALLIVKGWVRIYFAEGTLVTHGVYGLVRHPQYVGIVLIVIGELIDWPTISTLILAPVIVIAYVRLAKREEATLIKEFRTKYLDYMRSVPMFVPRWPDLRLLLSQR